MRIEAKYQEGLKKLIKEKQLEEINVVMLCEAVKSNRQTFYYHYRDISDVVESIFLKEKVGGNRVVKDFDSSNKAMIAYLNSNYSFVSAINNSFASDKFLSFVQLYYRNVLTELLKRENKDQHQLRLLVRILSSIFANEMQHWIANKRREKPTTLQNRFNVIYKYFLNQYFTDLRNEEHK